MGKQPTSGCHWWLRNVAFLLELFAGRKTSNFLTLLYLNGYLNVIPKRFSSQHGQRSRGAGELQPPLTKILGVGRRCDVRMFERTNELLDFPNVDTTVCMECENDLWCSLNQLNGFNVDLRKSLVSCPLNPSSKSTRGRVDSKPNYRVRCQLIPASVLFLFSAVTSDREKNKRQSPCYGTPQFCTTFSSYCEQETWSSFRTTANRNEFLELCCCQTFK